jgi:hypothetical protein
VNPWPMRDLDEGGSAAASQARCEPLAGAWPRARRPRTQKPNISYVRPMCRGGGCAAKVLVLTRGRPVDAEHMITTILMNLAEARVEVKRPGVADEPVVVVKRPADDLHGDMWRGENGTKAQSIPALGKKVTVEAKGGTQRKANAHPHAGRRGIEKTGETRPNHHGKEMATYAPSERPGRIAYDPARQQQNRKEMQVRWNS